MNLATSKKNLRMRKLTKMLGRGEGVSLAVYSLSHASTRYKTNTFRPPAEAVLWLAKAAAKAAAQLLLLH